MKEYLDSLTDPKDYRTGDPDLLPKYIGDLYGKIETLEETYLAEKWGMAPEDIESLEKSIIEARTEYDTELTNACDTYLEQQNSVPRSPTADYIESTAVEFDIFSGNPELLPKQLQESFKNLIQLEYDFFYNNPHEKSPYQDAFKNELDKYESDFFRQGEISVNMEINKIQNNESLEEKHSMRENSIKQNSDMKEQTTKPQVSSEEQTKTKEKREPQMITVNGDKITHAHAYKSNVSEDWFYTAKINGQTLKAQIMDKNDVERVLEKSATTQEMMQKYYPTVLMPKVNVAEFKLPRPITTGNGEEQILKFNVYKDKDTQKYKFYAQVGDKKMSTEASKQDLDAYFNRVATPVQIITKNFGDRLGMKEHYEQFKLPEGTGIEAKNILIKKNQQTNRYEISVNIPGHFETSSRELSYDDRQSYFQHKAATKEQLAAKYLNTEIMVHSQSPKIQNEKQIGMSR